MTNNSSNSKFLSEGALFTGIFLVLALLTYYTPLFLFSLIVLPVPFVINFVRTDLRTFLLSALASTLILFMLVDPLFSISMGLTAVLIGGALGFSFKRQYDGSKTLQMGALATLALFVVTFLLIQLILDFNVLQEASTNFYNTVKTHISSLEDMGAPSTQIEEWRSTAEQFRDNMIVFLPASLLLASIILAFVQIWVTNKVFAKLQYHTVSFPPFPKWQFPKFFGWVYLLASISLLLHPNTQGYLGMLSANVFTLANYVLLVQGLSLGFWFLNVKKKIPKVVTIFILVLVFIIPPLNMILVILGIFDMFFNLRKLSVE